MTRLSDRVNNMTPSATIALTAKVNRLREQGVDIITLNVGEPDMGTPENICLAAVEAIRQQKTKYTTVSGITELKKAICAKMLRDSGLEYTVENVTVSTGAKQALINAVFACVQPGDEVIIPSPCWVSYVEMVKLAGAKPVLVKCRKEDAFGLDMQALRAAVTPASKAVLINTPNNPTGAVYSRKELEELAELAEEKDLLIISDEVYEKLIYSDAGHVCAATVSEEAKNRTVVINGMSKSYAMTGWRLGYTVGPSEIIKAVNSIQGHATSNPNTISQYAALEALNGPQESVETMRQEFDRRRRYVYGRLSRMKGISCTESKGAFYLLPDVSFFFGKSFKGRIIKDSFDMADLILDEARVAVVPGAAFEAPDNIRISYSNSMDNLRTAMDRIEILLSEIK